MSREFSLTMRFTEMELNEVTRPGLCNLFSAGLAVSWCEQSRVASLGGPLCSLGLGWAGLGEAEVQALVAFEEVRMSYNLSHSQVQRKMC